MSTSTCHHDHADAAAPHGSESSACSSADPFARLDACHRHVLGTLTELDDALKELGAETEFNDRLRAAIGDTLALVQIAIPLHSADEEETLFPRLRKLPPFLDAPNTPMDCMEKDHVQHREMAASLARGLLQRDMSATKRAARNLIAEYRDHISKEDGVLIPMARELITDTEELAEMLSEMDARRVAAKLTTC